MHLNRAFAIVLRQFYLMRGSFTRVVPLFAWIGIDMLMWGFMSRYLSQITALGSHMMPVLLGAALMWSFFTRVMLGVTTAFFEDVWSRNFLNFFASPMTVTEYVTGLVLTSILTSAIGLIAILALAIVIFDFSLFSYGMLLFPFLMILFLFGIALGILGCGIVLRFGPSSEWFVWPIPAVLSPFVGVFYPLSTLPSWMQSVALALPPSYVFENVRSIVAGGSASLSGLWIGLALAVVYILLAGWCFTRIFKYTVRTGLIARYSAESIG